MFQQPGNPVCERSGFSATCAGDHQRGAGWSGDSRQLLFIEFGREINSAAGWRRGVKRVGAAHFEKLLGCAREAQGAHLGRREVEAVGQECGRFLRATGLCRSEDNGNHILAFVGTA